MSFPTSPTNGQTATVNNIAYAYSSSSGAWLRQPISNPNGSIYSMGRNRIINGNMYIAQRATTATVTAGTTVPTSSTGYPCVDRFFVYSTGANVTAAQVAGSGANKNLLQITGAASVTAVGIGQRIESLNSYDLAGQTCTLAADISNSLLTTVTWTAYYATTTADTFGTIGTPTKTSIATGTFTVTSTLTRYTANITLPAAATTGIEVLFTVGAQTSGTWQIGNVQFEAGSFATPFERLLYGTQQPQCQRYFCITDALGAGAANATTGFVSHVVFPVPMRGYPTAAVAGTGWAISDDYAADYAAPSPVIGSTYSVSTTSWRGQLTGFTGLTIGRFYAGRADISSLISFSAEL